MRKPCICPLSLCCPFVDFVDEAVAVFLCPVGQIIILKKIFQEETAFYKSHVYLKKPTSSLITPYKNVNDRTSAELWESYYNGTVNHLQSAFLLTESQRWQQIILI